MRTRSIAFLVVAFALAARVAAADPVMEANGACRLSAPPAPSNLFAVSNDADGGSASRARAWPLLQFGDAPPCPIRRLDFSALMSDSDAGGQNARPPVAFEYSHGYEVRDKVHKIASFTMLPLFGLEAYLGQKLLTNPASQGAKSAHKAIGMGIVGLFGVNTVTGVMNLVEGNKDPHRGKRPVIHGILMLAADAGFVATTFTGPKSRTAAQLAAFPAKATLHKTLAYASVSVATISYLMMLFK